jgi:hypothetical protein
MVIVMNPKRRTLWIASVLISTLLPVGARAAWLAEVRSVYLMPMANGMDQYLADRLTHDHVLQVVTDPKLADAVITDRLGEAFQAQLWQLRPELKPLPPPKPKSKKGADKDADADSDSDSDKDKEKKEDAPVISSFHAAHGTIFLVHVRTQQVVWSTYQQPGRTGSKDMERTAARIAGLLEKEMTPAAVGAEKK